MAVRCGSAELGSGITYWLPKKKGGAQ